MDLWPDKKFDAQPTDFPADILKQQAALLPKKSGGLIKGFVEYRLATDGDLAVFDSASEEFDPDKGVEKWVPSRDAARRAKARRMQITGKEEDWYYVSFDLVVPVLDAYSHRILHLLHPFSQYPCQVQSRHLNEGRATRCENLESFLHAVKEILGSSSMRLLIQHLMNQAKTEDAEGFVL